MFLHLITDEKFIEGTIVRFEKNDPGNHVFVYLLPLGKIGTSEHLKETRQIKFIAVHSPEYDELLKNLPEYTAVFVHSLIPRHFVEFINNADQRTTFVWLFWGADLWSLKQFKTRAYLPLTRLIYYKHQTDVQIEKLKINLRKYAGLFFRTGPFSTARTVGHRLRTGTGSVSHMSDRDVRRSIARVNYVIPVVPGDFDVLKSLLPCKAELLDWNYSPGPLEQFKGFSLDGRNMLLGNSALYTNNHVDILMKLRAMKSSYDKVIVPLSYGNSVYRKTVMKSGRLILGDAFSPLTDYLPLDDYAKLLSSCPVAIFNNIRQQAMGNVVLLLFLGSKVFLRTQNPIYKFFKNKSAVIFSVEQELNRKSIGKTLSEEERELNKMLVREFFSGESLDKKTKQMISYLNEKNKKKKISGGYI